MSLNALRKDYNPKRYKQRKKLYEAMKAYHDDSFLFDSYRLSLGQHDHYDADQNSTMLINTDYEYVNAHQIYDEFVKIDDDLKRENSYKPNLMLDIMERLLGTRYNAFYRIYKKQYRIKPISKRRYLDKAQKNLEKVLYKYDMDIAIDKWSNRESDKVTKAVVLLMNYYKSTGRFELADTLENTPLIKPKTFTHISKYWRKFHTSRMAKVCKINKKEANKLLQGVIKKIKSNF